MPTLNQARKSNVIFMDNEPERFPLKVYFCDLIYLTKNPVLRKIISEILEEGVEEK